MSCVDAPHAIGLVPQIVVDAPHAVGLRLGVVDAPGRVRVVLVAVVDAPSAVGVRVLTAPFHVVFLGYQSLAVDESGVSGGPGDGTGGTSGSGG